MAIRLIVEEAFGRQTRELGESAPFRKLESGADEAFYDAFISNLSRTHLRSPQILGFLFSVAPPAAIVDLRHNLLEELGAEPGETSHPELLHKLLRAARFSPEQVAGIEKFAQEDLRRMVCDPMLYGTIREVGLAGLIEVVAFEWMLSRLARRMGDSLLTHRRIEQEGLAWFYHHSEVDIRHAEEGLSSIERYLDYYQFDSAEFEAILEITLRENLFIKRYFGELELGHHKGMLTRDET